MSQDKIYIFYKNKIYTMKKEKELLEIFDLFQRNEEILIPEDRLKDFEQYVIPKIKICKNRFTERRSKRRTNCR